MDLKVRDHVTGVSEEIVFRFVPMSHVKEVCWGTEVLAHATKIENAWSVILSDRGRELQQERNPGMLTSIEGLYNRRGVAYWVARTVGLYCTTLNGVPDPIHPCPHRKQAPGGGAVS